MLYQITVLALALNALGDAAPITLSPQLEAEDRDDLSDKLAHWLSDTGYQVAPGSEPQVIEIHPETGAKLDAQLEQDPQVSALTARVVELEEANAEWTKRIQSQRQAFDESWAEARAELDAEKLRASKLETRLREAGEIYETLSKENAELKRENAALRDVPPVASSEGGEKAPE